MAKKIQSGLVLSGGGARAAYQAGVLRAVSDLLGERGLLKEPPFQIFCGESAGAINASLLAAHVDDFARGTAELWRCWDELRMEDIFSTSPVSLLSNATRWMSELSLGGLLQKGHAPYLLDTTPLRKYLAPRIDFEKIRKLVQTKHLRGLGISATNYCTGSAVTFYESLEDVEPWARSHRIGIRTELKLDHVLASAAIPIIFPPVKIGHCFFGDGSVRLKSPLSPAIHLGATRLLAVGLRYYRTPEQTVELNQNQRMHSLALADIAGVLLNAGFLDNLDSDLERLERINHTLALIPEHRHGELPSQLRPISALAVRPSKDLGQLASQEFENFSRLLRYFLRGLGTSKQSGWDLVSYLAFDKAYTRKLLDLGYEDGLARKEELLAFFGGESA
jgi:NTE family protein